MVQGRLRAAFVASSFDAASSNDEIAIQFTKVDRDSVSFFVLNYVGTKPASSRILNGEYYEPLTHKMVAQLMSLRPGSLVHAGTFFGDMLPTFSHACPCTVYASEPVLENFVLAKLCVQQNVWIQNSGLSSVIKIGRVDTGDDEGIHRGGASEISHSGQLTSLVTIDSLGIDDLSLIQLDVEGHELEALKGAVRSIEKNQPEIMIEDNNNDCSAFLESVAYRFRMQATTTLTNTGAA